MGKGEKSEKQSPEKSSDLILLQKMGKTENTGDPAKESASEERTIDS